MSELFRHYSYAKVATTEEIMAFDGNMNINFYVKRDNSDDEVSFVDALQNWEESSKALNLSMQKLFEELSY